MLKRLLGLRELLLVPPLGFRATLLLVLHGFVKTMLAPLPGIKNIILAPHPSCEVMLEPLAYSMGAILALLPGFEDVPSFNTIQYLSQALVPCHDLALCPCPASALCIYKVLELILPQNQVTLPSTDYEDCTGIFAIVVTSDK